MMRNENRGSARQERRERGEASQGKLFRIKIGIFKLNSTNKVLCGQWTLPLMAFIVVSNKSQLILMDSKLLSMDGSNLNP